MSAASSNVAIISSCCNFSYRRPLLKSHSSFPSFLSSPKPISLLSVKSNYSSKFSKISSFWQLHNIKKKKKGQQLQICHTSSNKTETSREENEELVIVDGGGGGDGEDRDWTTSFLLFAFWSGLMYYVLFLAPNQTPVTDMYFLQKLLNLKGDDGFQLNEVLVALWYIMGLWPLVYSMLLLPTARSAKGKIPVWPFMVLSCFGGAYALIPYFVLWRPPPPPVDESELSRWPLNFLESKVTAGITLAAGLAITAYAFSSGGDVWKEFYQYFNGSKFIHVTSIDFALLSTFAPFWVYNDMSVRKRDDKSSWLLPLSIIPLLGPALYLLLRPSLVVAPVESKDT